MRFHDQEAVMQKMGIDFQVLDSGCCGMAGSFGYEADKYEVSINCGERALLPAVRKAGVSTLIMADGFSCREQIAQETGRHALHLAEVIQTAQQKGPHGSVWMYPETELVKRRKDALRRARTRSITALIGLALGGLLLAGLTKKH
jgi:hypothetical protein